MKTITVLFLALSMTLFVAGCSKHTVKTKNPTDTQTTSNGNNNTTNGSETGSQNTDNSNTGSDSTKNERSENRNQTSSGNTDNNTNNQTSSGSSDNTTDNQTSSGTNDNNTGNQTQNHVEKTLYEDGTHLSHWAPSETSAAHIGKITSENGRIKITTTGKSARYILYKDNQKGLWNDPKTVASWEVQTNARHEVMFLTHTKNHGDVYIVFASAMPNVPGYRFDEKTGEWLDAKTSKPTGWGKYLYIILPDAADGKKQTYSKNLDTLLKNSKAFQNDAIETVTYALVINWDKGKDLYIDNIALSAVQ